MLSVALAFSTLLAAVRTPVPPAGWERVVESTGPKEWVSSILAFGADTWFVGGVGWLARSTTGRQERTSTGASAVLGLSGERPDDVFALGDHELIMHFDGKTWSEEHGEPKPRRPDRGADILHSLLLDNSKLVAFGPTLVLVRMTDRRWQAASPSEQKRLLEMADSGPSHVVPAQCDEAGWFWLGRDRALFDCHDGRSFAFDAGKITPKGTLPRDCRRAFQRVTAGQEELFATCGPGNVWKTEGDHWTLYAAFTGVKELVSISVTNTCVFVASNRTVWRSCKR